jgi:MFS family permease
MQHNRTNSEGTSPPPSFQRKPGGILRNLKTFDSLKNAAFRSYYFGLLGNMVSMNMQIIARSLLLYRLTGSAAILGLLALSHALPMVFLSLFGGVIADRLPKKLVLVVGHGCLSVVSLTVALSLTLGYLSAENAGSWWILLAASLAQGIVMGLMVPSRQAIIPELVGGKLLMNAVALNVFGMNTARIMAPAAAGFLIDTIGFAVIYYIMTGLYMMAGIFFSLIPRSGASTDSKRTVLSDLKSGLQYVRQNATILYLLVFTLFVICLSMPYMSLMPIFTDDILEVGATGMGTLISLSGIGAIASSVILASLPNKRRGAILLISSLLMGVALIGFSFSNSYYLSMALIVFVGMGQAGRATLANTLLQYYVDEAYRGRVMSIYIMEFGLRSFGVFLAGLLAEEIGVQWSIGGLAVILVIVSLAAILFIPRIRRLE